jgi:hypothetical protein
MLGVGTALFLCPQLPMFFIVPLHVMVKEVQLNFSG